MKAVKVFFVIIIFGCNQENKRSEEGFDNSGIDTSVAEIRNGYLFPIKEDLTPIDSSEMLIYSLGEKDSIKVIRMKLEELKGKDHFPTDEWLERGLNPSSKDVQSLMNEDVDAFIDYVLVVISNPNIHTEHSLSHYLKNWKRRRFDTEEMEFIFDIFYEVMVVAGIDPEKVPIY